MRRRDMRRGMMVALAIIAVIFLLSPGLTFAGVGASDTPTVTSPVAVGQTGLPWSFTIENAATGTETADTMEIQSIFFITACGSAATPGICLPGDQEVPPPPGDRITINSPATGEAGTACAGKSFTVTSTGNPNEYEFTTSPLVILAPKVPGGPLATCKVNFTVNIVNAPTKDSSGAAGLQTSQHARLLLKDTTTNETGGGTGTSTVTIFSIVTEPNPKQGFVNATLNDKATLSGGNNPTGTITFKLFGPGNDTCSGNPICTKAVPVTGNKTYDSTPSGCTANAGPGTYHWIASYGGDANNPPVSSICADEAVVITKCTPLFSTAPSPENGCAGAVLNDIADLEGGCNPTGTITFKLFGPNNDNCSGNPICTKTVNNVNGNGSYPTPSGCTVTQDGTY